jgi:hypothetical protein
MVDIYVFKNTIIHINTQRQGSSENVFILEIDKNKLLPPLNL